MAARGYTSTTAVSLLLGGDGYATLTVNQSDRMSQGLLEAAENLIDAHTGRAWLTGGTVTAERHTIQSGRVWLAHKPITSVAAVRLGGPFETGATLTVTTDYYVEPERGLITFRAHNMHDVSVDYTVPQVVPADVAEAAGQIVAGWLQDTQTTAGPAGTFKSITTDGQNLVWRDPATLPPVPAVVLSLLARWCRPVLA